MRNRMVRVFLMVSLFAWAASALAQVESSKADDIKHLIEVSGSDQMAAEWVSEFGNQLKNALSQSSSSPERSQQIVGAFIQKLSDRFSAEWKDLLVGIYDRHLSQEEVKELIKFYESPLGRRLKDAMPKITEESTQAGLKRGGELIQEILRGMADQFPELKPNR